MFLWGLKASFDELELYSIEVSELLCIIYVNFVLVYESIWFLLAVCLLLNSWDSNPVTESELFF